VFPKQIQHQVKQLLFGATGDQPGTELTQDRVIEARINEFQGERILSVDAAANGIRGLLIREALDILHNGDQCQPPRSFGRFSACWEQRREGFITIDCPYLIAHPHEQVPFAKRSASDACSLVRNRGNIVGMEAHGEAPSGD